MDKLLKIARKLEISFHAFSGSKVVTSVTSFIKEKADMTENSR